MVLVDRTRPAWQRSLERVPTLLASSAVGQRMRIWRVAGRRGAALAGESAKRSLRCSLIRDAMLVAGEDKNG